MSYILEGLKKLEEKRRQEEKTLHPISFQGHKTEKPEKKPLWPYLLVAVLLLNAGVFAWWIGPWRSVRTSVNASQPVERKNEPEAAATIPVEQKKKDEPIPAKNPQQTEVVNRLETSNTAKTVKEAGLSSTKDTPAPKQLSAPVVKDTPVPRQAAVAIPALSDKSKPPSNRRIVKLDELPSDIRKDIPDLKVSAHFYSTDHQARFVRVNDRILHEEEALKEGLKVEEINSDGTVFSYKGWRFQININETR